MPIERESLDIIGYKGKTISNIFLKQNTIPKYVSIVLPGLSYNVDMPLLYYATGILIEAGHSVLVANTRYSEAPDFKLVSDQERKDWMFKDTEAIYNAIQEQDEYVLSTIIGKSLGTIQMSYIVQNYPDVQKCRMCWLTPLIQNNWVLEQMIAQNGESLVIIGTADSHYDDITIGMLVEEGKCEVHTISQGNHSLDVPSGVLDSMNQLTNIMRTIKDFVMRDSV